MDDGGLWKLDVSSWRRAKKLLGLRVLVKGARSEFDVIDVNNMCVAEPLDGP